MQSSTEHITLTTLTGMISGALSRGVGDHYWVVAQVNEAKLNYSGHFYMELAEYRAGQTLPVAAVKAVIWSRTYRMIASYFRQATGGDIVPGVQLLVRCSVSFHEVYGLSLVVDDIDPTYTLGQAEMVRQQTIDRLTREGVVDMNRQIELPMVLQRLAVVSSPTAAGYEDFMNELLQSGVAFDVDLFQAVMQGQAAARSIVEALERVAGSDVEYDAVVVVRGGGSRGDLACYDDYELCANVAQFPLPVVAGIGHEKDVSALDLVACRSLKTPTAVAGMLVDVALGFLAELDDLGRRIEQQARRTVADESARVERLGLQLSQSGHRAIHVGQIILRDRQHALQAEARQFVARKLRNVEQMAAELTLRPEQQIALQYRRLDLLYAQLSSVSRSMITKRTHDLALKALRVEGSDPRRILSMGYAIVRGATGRSLKTTSDVAPGEELGIELSDGRVISIVERVEKHRKSRKTTSK